MKLQSDRGNVILIFVVFLFVLAMQMLYFFSSHMAGAQKNERKYSVHSDLQQILVIASALLGSHHSSINTIKSPLNNNPATNRHLESCFNVPTFDCPPGDRPFSIVSEDATATNLLERIVVNADDPDQGFGMNLQPCLGFNDPNNLSCVFQLRLTWRPACPLTGPCTMPGIIVSGQVVVKQTFQDLILINTADYIFQKSLR